MYKIYGYTDNSEKVTVEKEYKTLRSVKSWLSKYKSKYTSVIIAKDNKIINIDNENIEQSSVSEFDILALKQGVLTDTLLKYVENTGVFSEGVSQFKKTFKNTKYVLYTDNTLTCGCKVSAADVLDILGLEKYINNLYKSYKYKTTYCNGNNGKVILFDSKV